jgi:exodeoxyribonuclease VII small subunit
MTKQDLQGLNFETAIESLEEVVEHLESGDLSLEDSLAAFEKGVGLVRYCSEKLNEVQKRVELLVRDKEGHLQLKAVANNLRDTDSDQ